MNSHSAPTLRLILGDQLNPHHRWYSETDDAAVDVLMAVRQETDDVLHRAQKILAILPRCAGKAVVRVRSPGALPGH